MTLATKSKSNSKVTVEMVSKEEDISKLEILFKEKYIGVDTEWKPYLGTKDRDSQVSLMQMSG